MYCSVQVNFKFQLSFSGEKLATVAGHSQNKLNGPFERRYRWFQLARANNPQQCLSRKLCSMSSVYKH